MKIKLVTSIITSALALASMANAAVTVSIKNFTSATAGVLMLDQLGNAAALNTIYASVGIFSSVPNFTTSTAVQIAAAFTPIDNTPLTNSAFTGLFTGNDLLGQPYPANFSGVTPYILVGNNSNLALATFVAVYKGSGIFSPVDGAGNANVPISATNIDGWVFGNVAALTPGGKQSSLSGSNFSSGLQLAAVPTAIPEPSAALLGVLGVLGLLRRRRI